MQENLEVYTLEEPAKILKFHPRYTKKAMPGEKVPVFKFGGNRY